MKKKILDYFQSINCITVSIHGCNCCKTGVDFTKGFKTWHKFSTEIRFMHMPITVLFIAHEFITGNFDITGKHRVMTEHSTKIYL